MKNKSRLLALLKEEFIPAYLKEVVEIREDPEDQDHAKELIQRNIEYVGLSFLHGERRAELSIESELAGVVRRTHVLYDDEVIATYENQDYDNPVLAIQTLIAICKTLFLYTSDKETGDIGEPDQPESFPTESQLRAFKNEAQEPKKASDDTSVSLRQRFGGMFLPQGLRKSLRLSDNPETNPDKDVGIRLGSDFLKVELSANNPNPSYVAIATAQTGETKVWTDSGKTVFTGSQVLSELELVKALVIEKSAGLKKSAQPHKTSLRSSYDTIFKPDLVEKHASIMQPDSKDPDSIYLAIKTESSLSYLAAYYLDDSTLEISLNAKTFWTFSSPRHPANLVVFAALLIIEAALAIESKTGKVAKLESVSEETPEDSYPKVMGPITKSTQDYYLYEAKFNPSGQIIEVIAQSNIQAFLVCIDYAMEKEIEPYGVTIKKFHKVHMLKGQS